MVDAWTFDEAVEQMMALGRSMDEQGLRGRVSLHDDLLRGRSTGSTTADPCFDSKSLIYPSDG